MVNRIVRNSSSLEVSCLQRVVHLHKKCRHNSSQERENGVDPQLICNTSTFKESDLVNCLGDSQGWVEACSAIEGNSDAAPESQHDSKTFNDFIRAFESELIFDKKKDDSESESQQGFEEHYLQEIDPSTLSKNLNKTKHTLGL